MPGVLGVFTAAGPRPRTGRRRRSTHGRPHAARQRQGPLRRRTGRRRRRRDRRPGHRRRRDGVRRRRLPPGARRHRGGARLRDTDLRGAGSNVVFDTTALGMPENCDADDFFADCEVVVSGTLRQPTRRAVPARGPRLGRHMGRRSPAPVAVDAARAGRQGRRSPRPTASTATRCASSRPTSAVASAPRSARTPRRCCSVRSRQGDRPPGALARDPQRVDDGVSATVGPRCSTSPSAAPATARSPTTNCTSSRTPARSPRSGAILAPFMTRPMASGVYDIPNIEVPRHLGRHQHHAHRGLPRRRPARGDRRRSNGRWTCSPLEIGKDPADVRRMNLIPKFLDAHTTSIGQTYDVGDFEGALDKALDAAGYDALRAEQAAPSGAGDDEAARHRRLRLRRDHRRRRARRRGAPRSRCRTTAAPASTPAPRRTGRATTPRGR